MFKIFKHYIILDLGQFSNLVIILIHLTVSVLLPFIFTELIESEPYRSYIYIIVIKTYSYKRDCGPFLRDSRRPVEQAPPWVEHHTRGPITIAVVVHVTMSLSHGIRTKVGLLKC